MNVKSVYQCKTSSHVKTSPDSEDPENQTVLSLSVFTGPGPCEGASHVRARNTSDFSSAATLLLPDSTTSVPLPLPPLPSPAALRGVPPAAAAVAQCDKRGALSPLVAHG